MVFFSCGHGTYIPMRLNPEAATLFKSGENPLTEPYLAIMIGNKFYCSPMWNCF